MSVGESATPLGKVRGLGSAREGGEHWLAERVTERGAAAARRLADRLACCSCRRSTSATLVEWLRAPSGAVPMALFVIIGFHARARRHEGGGRRLCP